MKDDYGKMKKENRLLIDKANKHNFLFICMYVCMYACMYVCIYVCIYMYMNECMYVCIYEHICDFFTHCLIIMRAKEQDGAETRLNSQQQREGKIR